MRVKLLREAWDYKITMCFGQNLTKMDMNLENKGNTQFCTFKQVSDLITQITSSFSETIKSLIEKFEANNIHKIDKLEGQIFTVNERVDILEEKLIKMYREKYNALHVGKTRLVIVDDSGYNLIKKYLDQ